MSFREIAAFFIRDQCLFGAYPTQHQIHELEEWGVDLIVNLTSRHEKNIRTYSTFVKTINFIISDNKAPENVLEFCALIIHITKLIDQNQKIYIHCKGGHGRSGVLVASILCYKYRIIPHEAIQLTTKYHSTRPIHARRPKMNEYWKSKGSPQTKEQKQFVVSIFHPYVVTKESPFNQKGIWLRNTALSPVGFGATFLKGLTLSDIIALEDGRSTLLDGSTKSCRMAYGPGPKAAEQSSVALPSDPRGTLRASSAAQAPYGPVGSCKFCDGFCSVVPKNPYPTGGTRRVHYMAMCARASPGGQHQSINDFIDSFLLSTNLGPITGNNGNELEKYRDSLIENLVFFP